MKKKEEKLEMPTTLANIIDIKINKEDIVQLLIENKLEHIQKELNELPSEEKKLKERQAEVVIKAWKRYYPKNVKLPKELGFINLAEIITKEKALQHSLYRTDYIPCTINIEGIEINFKITIDSDKMWIDKLREEYRAIDTSIRELYQKMNFLNSEKRYWSSKDAVNKLKSELLKGFLTKNLDLNGFNSFIETVTSKVLTLQAPK